MSDIRSQLSDRKTIQACTLRLADDRPLLMFESWRLKSIIMYSIRFFRYSRSGGPIARKILEDCPKVKSGKRLGRKNYFADRAGQWIQCEETPALMRGDWLAFFIAKAR
jgi:hypothetical protein